MKVLFAVSNENISDSIVKKYQREYKEIISYKNVYYFNAILKEIQKDKTYDRIVISEDLEQFTNNNYSQIDKFIFDKLDSISDEASDLRGNDIPIILICTDRRNKSEDILVKLFGLGIYNALIGKDRSIDEVCNLINKPRTKKEAKTYYKIDTDEVGYDATKEDDVSEIEIQNILAHYKRLGKNEEKYVESFNNIATQYTDNQLRVIVQFLPLNVRAVLEANSAKYQEIITFGNGAPMKSSNKNKPTSVKIPEKKGTSERLIKSSSNKMNITEPVVIPSPVNTQNVRKIARKPAKLQAPVTTLKKESQVQEGPVKNVPKVEAPRTEISNPQSQRVEEAKTQMPEVQETKNLEKPVTPVKRGRGRPKKIRDDAEETKPKRGRGRPKKNNNIEEQFKIDDEKFDTLPGLDEADENLNALPGVNEEVIENTLPGVEEESFDTLPGVDEKEEAVETLPGLDDSENDFEVLPGLDESGDDFDTLPGLDNSEDNFEVSPGLDNKVDTFEAFSAPEKNDRFISTNVTYHDTISNLISRDKKIVTFVGTSKNGTSFLVNNLAELLSSTGIKIAILDTTKNKNSYYIYTKNEENLRKIAYDSFEKLKQGVIDGIKVNKNLDVFTSLPGEEITGDDVTRVLTTLIKNYSLVLVDSDFETDLGFFANTQELYLVQSMDVLTIQPLTAFLKELKNKNILEQRKLRIVINKQLRMRGITSKNIIGGMAFYNDPSMSVMTDLFDRTSVKYCEIPFEEQTYNKYLEGLINCDISLNGYSKTFMTALKELGNIVFPLINSRNNYAKRNDYNNFSDNMNNTLNQMKNRY